MSLGSASHCAPAAAPAEKPPPALDPWASHFAPQPLCKPSTFLIYPSSGLLRRGKKQPRGQPMRLCFL
ncbi:unnamed protein product, partial [Clonostachys solani]